MIGIFGGTFDPVHYGHLRTALEVAEQVELEQVRFIPCGLPPHRAIPVAHSADRLAMLALATADQPGFTIDEREIQRSGPSYMVDTLVSLREELGDTEALGLILGMDAFLALDSWHQWEQLIELAHLLVMTRPGWDAAASGSESIQNLVAKRTATDIKSIQQHAAGKIAFLSVSKLGISSSMLREKLAAGNSCRYLLPDSVYHYIKDKQIY